MGTTLKAMKEKPMTWHSGLESVSIKYIQWVNIIVYSVGSPFSG